MKINEVIRNKRIAKGLTQEQVAVYLGVSAPAVNKWEKAVSYPDITLLPALARLLETDLNTLLSFQDDLSTQEISLFLTELSAKFRSQGLESAFTFAMHKVHEYPSCDALLLNTALALESLILMNGETLNEDIPYTDAIHQLYIRSSKSQNTQTAAQAKSILAAKYINNKDFENAKMLLEELPDEIMISKKQLQITLQLAHENIEEGACLCERSILSSLNAINSCLLILMDIALKQEENENAEYIVNTINEMTTLFDLWPFNAYSAQFLLAVAQGNDADCVSCLEKIVTSLKERWTPSSSLLYHHLSPKKEDEETGLFFLQNIIAELKKTENDEYAFLRESPLFQSFLKANNM